MSWLDNQQRREKWQAFVHSLNPDIDPKAVRLMDSLYFVSRMVHHMGESGLEKAGMSLAQYRILIHLFFAQNMSERGELNPSEISERQGVSRNTISSLIRSLENDGLIDRRLDKEDRRKFNISLTEKGEAIVSQYSRAHFERVSQCFSGLTEAEQDTLAELLNKVGAHVTAVRENS
jgi:DNA-binding MarR family transcriptional regulator